jgi:hypothetical protein
MKNVRRALPRAALALLGIACAALPARAEIHECRSASGEIVYQDEPCTVVVEKPPAPPPVKPRPKPTPKPARPPAPRARASTRPTPKTWVVPPRSAPVPAIPRRQAGSIDPRFATPERAWSTFLDAMRAGDRSTALACLTSGARASLGPLVESGSAESLRERADALGRVEVEGHVGPFWSLRARGTGNRPRWIFLEQTERGEWKIAAI